MTRSSSASPPSITAATTTTSSSSSSKMTLCRRYSQELDAANIADARTTLYVVIGRSTSIGKQQLASDAPASPDQSEPSRSPLPAAARRSAHSTPPANRHQPQRMTAYAAMSRAVSNRWNCERPATQMRNGSDVDDFAGRNWINYSSADRHRSAEPGTSEAAGRASGGGNGATRDRWLVGRRGQKQQPPGMFPVTERGNLQLCGASADVRGSAAECADAGTTQLTG